MSSTISEQASSLYCKTVNCRKGDITVTKCIEPNTTWGSLMVTVKSRIQGNKTESSQKLKSSRMNFLVTSSANPLITSASSVKTQMIKLGGLLKYEQELFCEVSFPQIG